MAADAERVVWQAAAGLLAGKYAPLPMRASTDGTARMGGVYFCASFSTPTNHSHARVLSSAFVYRMLTELCPFSKASLGQASEKADARDRFAFFSDIQAAGPDWDAAAPKGDVFLAREYLAALESSPPPGLRLGYLVFYHGEEPAGVALLQWHRFDGREQLRELTVHPGAARVWESVLARCKRQVADRIQGEVLVCGNPLLTGEHGFYFSQQYFSVERATSLLLSALKTVAQRYSPHVAAVVIKDLYPDRAAEHAILTEAQYTAFSVQPNMILALPYGSFEEYLAAMTTKYRTRAKRAFKKAADLERRRLGLREIQQALPQLHALYTSVAQRSGFHWVSLDDGYLPALQHHLPENFHLIGWYRQGQLVGFHTAIENGCELEAHFLGYEESANTAHQLYLNMLYDLVRLGIEGGFERVVLGRTALEIKSSVGASPQDLRIYLRLQHPWLRRLCSPLLHYLMPEERWVERHPFKEFHTMTHASSANGNPLVKTEESQQLDLSHRGRP